ALFRNMAAALIKHEQITTTVAKAKELRPYVEKLVTLAKRGGLSNRRLAQSRLMDDAQLIKLFDVIAPRYASRNGGYTRVIKAGIRSSDAAPIAGIEFVERDLADRGRCPADLCDLLSIRADRQRRRHPVRRAGGGPLPLAGKRRPYGQAGRSLGHCGKPGHRRVPGQAAPPQLVQAADDRALR